MVDDDDDYNDENASDYEWKDRDNSEDPDNMQDKRTSGTK